VSLSVVEALPQLAGLCATFGRSGQPDSPCRINQSTHKDLGQGMCIPELSPTVCSPPHYSTPGSLWTYLKLNDFSVRSLNTILKPENLCLTWIQPFCSQGPFSHSPHHPIPYPHISILVAASFQITLSVSVLPHSAQVKAMEHLVHAWCSYWLSDTHSYHTPVLLYTIGHIVQIRINRTWLPLFTIFYQHQVTDPDSKQKVCG